MSLFPPPSAMASPLDTSLYEPQWRVGHALFKFNQKLYLIGGKDMPTSSVDIFDPATLTWKQVKTEGHAPTAIDYSAFTTLGGKAFFFGGYEKGKTNHFLTNDSYTDMM